MMAVAVAAAASSFFAFIVSPWAGGIWLVASGWWLVAIWLVAGSCLWLVAGWLVAIWLVAGGGGTGTTVFSTIRVPFVSSCLREGFGGGSMGMPCARPEVVALPLEEALPCGSQGTARPPFV